MPLVITRRRGDCVVIGEGDRRVVVVIVDARGGDAKLAIEAPDGTLVARGELAGEPRRLIGPEPRPPPPPRRRRG